MNKYFTNTKNLEELRKAYKKYATTLHPDTKGGNVEAFQEMQAEYDATHKALTSGSNNAFNMGEKFKNIIDELLKFTGVNIDIVGEWVWIYGDTKQFKEELKGMGFKWASKKKMWFWYDTNDGYFKKHRGGEKSYGEIIGKYGRTSFGNGKPLLD